MSKELSLPAYILDYLLQAIIITVLSIPIVEFIKMFRRVRTIKKIRSLVFFATLEYGRLTRGNNWNVNDLKSMIVKQVKEQKMNRLISNLYINQEGSDFIHITYNIRYKEGPDKVILNVTHLKQVIENEEGDNA